MKKLDLGVFAGVLSIMMDKSRGTVKFYDKMFVVDNGTTFDDYDINERRALSTVGFYRNIESGEWRINL